MPTQKGKEQKKNKNTQDMIWGSAVVAHHSALEKLAHTNRNLEIRAERVSKMEFQKT